MKKSVKLPFSIEKVAAYLDANLSSDEMHVISECVAENQLFGEFIDSCDSIPDNVSLITEDFFEDKNDDFVNFTLPEINGFREELIESAEFMDEVIDDISENNFDEIDAFSDRLSQIPTSIIVDESERVSDESNNNFTNSHQETLDVSWNKTSLNMAGTTMYGGRTLFGEAGENIKDPIFIRQPDDHSCALRSQQIVLRDFGIDIPFQDLERIALENHVYSDDGTLTCDIGKVLELAGVGMHQVIGSSMYDLTNELSQGHRVIVSVDANELWYNNSLTGKMANWLNDALGNQGGNHALIVAGVEVNPNDPTDVKVVLTDPGSGDLRIEYPMKQFMDAWQDSHCFMAATDQPAPYQYDSSTGLEVPSNFFVEHQYNQFIVDNSYQLSPDLINVPEGYAAAYNGHLSIVGDMQYEEFSDRYKVLSEMRDEFSSELGNHEQSEITVTENHYGDEQSEEESETNEKGHSSDDDESDDDESDEDESDDDESDEDESDEDESDDDESDEFDEGE